MEVCYCSAAPFAYLLMETHPSLSKTINQYSFESYLIA